MAAKKFDRMPDSDYNLYAFEKLVRDVPRSKTLMYMITVSGLLYSTILHLFVEKQLNWNIGSTAFAEILLVATLVFIVPAIVSGGLYSRFLKRVKKNWGLAIALIGETIFFGFLLLMNVSDTVQLSWKFYWAGVLSVFLATYTILVLSAGNHGIRKLGLLSSAHGLMLILPAYYFIGQFQAFTRAEFASKVGILFVTGLILIALVIIHEYLMKVNISDINGSHLTSGLLQSKEEELLAGYPAEPVVYNLEIENEDGEFSFGAPWVHPGPLGGFGGATLTQKVIEHKNDGGEGFFLHLPSTHQSDPVHPDSAEKIVDAFAEAEKQGEASELVEQEFEDMVMRGRRLGDKKIIFIETDEYDDFEKEIFLDIIDPEEVLIFDQHSHPEHRNREMMHNSSISAEKTRKNLEEFIGKLEEQPLKAYSAGYGVERNGKDVMALVEEVGDQKTLLIGSDENGPCETVLKAEKNYEDRFDHVNIFTTDTHKDLKDLASKRNVEEDRLSSAVEKADKTLSNASIGFETSRSEPVNLLHRDYYGLMHSINILTRLFPLSVIILYISAMLWIL